MPDDAGQPDWLRQLQATQSQSVSPAAPQFSADPRGFSAPAGAPVGPSQGFAPAPPAQPGNGPGAFSAASLVSDDALPEWLRAASGGAPNSTPLGSGMLTQPQPGGWGTPPSAQAYTPQSPAPSYGQSGQLGQPQTAPTYVQQPTAPTSIQQAAPGSMYGQQQAAPVYSQQPVYQPAPQTSGPLALGMSANALFDDAALPEWLRQASAGQEMSQPPAGYGAGYGLAAGGQPGAGGAGVGYPVAPQTPQRPHIGASPAPSYGPPQQAPGGAFPSIEQAGGYQAGAGIGSNLGGQALIDPNALPSWLGGQSAAPANGNGTAGGGMSAQSLVDEAALPQWLRAEPATPAQPGPAPVAASPAVPGWATGAVADEPLPSWLNQVYVDAQVPRSNPQPGAGAGWPSPSGSLGQAARPPAAAGTSGMLSASAFVDEAALPEWLKSQAQPAMPGAGMAVGSPAASLSSPKPAAMGSSGTPAYVPGSGSLQSTQMYSSAGADDASAAAGTFAASDLIDPQALPSWVRGEDVAPASSFSSTAGWTSKQPAMPPSGMQRAGASFQGGVAAPGTGGLAFGEAGQSGALSYGMGGQSGALSYGSSSPQGSPAGFAASDLVEEPNLPSWMQSMQQATGALAMPRESLTPPDERPQRGMPTGSFGYDAPRAREPRQDPAAARRRGPPIPAQELPPWLQASGADRGGVMNRGPQPQAERGRGAPMMQQMQHMPQAESQEWWPDDGGSEPQWTDWNDGQYAEGYDDFEQDQGRGMQRRGWRRFFGRK